jgi:hypothetical protein
LTSAHELASAASAGQRDDQDQRRESRHRDSAPLLLGQASGLELIGILREMVEILRGHLRQALVDLICVNPCPRGARWATGSFAATLRTSARSASRESMLWFAAVIDGPDQRRPGPNECAIEYQASRLRSACNEKSRQVAAVQRSRLARPTGLKPPTSGVTGRKV